MRVNDLLLELYRVESQTWFIRRISNLDITDDALRARLEIGEGLFVQIFLSERSGRFSMALIQGNQRLYGRDREYGTWHRHPFHDPSTHELTPEGVSPRPLQQFIAEVEEILLKHGLV